MKIVGHRGAKDLAAENTLQSFEKALEYHVDEIEFDVRITKDGHVIVAHDPYITDASGSRTDIVSHDLEVLRKHRPGLCTLEEAIRNIDHRAPIYIELKPGVATGPVVKIVRRFLADGWNDTDFLFGSYSQAILLELHKALPNITTIVIENWSSIRAVRRARELGTSRVSMLEYWLWPGFIRAMKRRGIELYSFPGRKSFKQRVFRKFGLVGATNDPERAHKWERAGLSGVITDRPDLFRKL